MQLLNLSRYQRLAHNETMALPKVCTTHFLIIISEWVLLSLGNLGGHVPTQAHPCLRHCLQQITQIQHKIYIQNSY